MTQSCDQQLHCPWRSRRRARPCLLVRARYGEYATGRTPQYRVNACSRSLNPTSRVAASWCLTSARALSSSSSTGTPPKCRNTPSCVATIRIVVVLPHPGMLPSRRSIASPECSRSTNAAIGATQSSACRRRALVCLSHAHIHEAAQRRPKHPNQDLIPLAEPPPWCCRASWQGAHPAKQRTLPEREQFGRGVAPPLRAGSPVDRSADADHRRPLRYQPARALSSLPFCIAERTLARRLVLLRHAQAPVT